MPHAVAATAAGAVVAAIATTIAVIIATMLAAAEVMKAAEAAGRPDHLVPVTRHDARERVLHREVRVLAQAEDQECAAVVGVAVEVVAVVEVPVTRGDVTDGLGGLVDRVVVPRRQAPVHCGVVELAHDGLLDRPGWVPRNLQREAESRRRGHPPKRPCCTSSMASISS
jgi:hypothetical protein